MMARFARSRHVAVVCSACVLGIQLTLTGCGLYSSKSDYERFQEGQKSFAQLISNIGGEAELGEQSLMGFKATGWTIDLSGAKITDSLIDKIILASRGSPVLDLNLSGTNVTDDQLKKLDKEGVLVKTVNLDLSHTKITDAGLDGINSVVGLTTLNLEGSQATKAGAERLGKRKIANPTTPAPLKKQPTVKI